MLRPTRRLLLDFETACHGPVEWELAALADETIASSPTPTAI
jgi:hypothetical protein